jgi:hypothetical protein
MRQGMDWVRFDMGRQASDVVQCGVAGRLSILPIDDSLLFFSTHLTRLLCIYRGDVEIRFFCADSTWTTCLLLAASQVESMEDREAVALLAPGPGRR